MKTSMENSQRISHSDRIGKKRHYKRLLFKNGDTNITHCSVKDKRRHYLADIFTTLLDSKWTYAILLFVAAFMLSWLVGGLIWLLVAFSRRDTDSTKSNDDRCVNHVFSFVTAFEFSLETQTTIGYGSRVPNSFCPEVTLFMMLQSVLGVLILAFMTGLVFSKITRPGMRAGALMFSREAVVSKRDNKMVLLIRVGDMRRSQLMEASVCGTLVRKRITRENEILPLEQFPVDFSGGSGKDRLFLPFPSIVEHHIDSSSPFWDISADDLQHEQFELIVALSGTAESTGSATEARTSYLPSEVRWGHNFERLVTYQKENGRYQIDFNKFNSTRPVPHFSRMSARELKEAGQTADLQRDLPQMGLTRAGAAPARQRNIFTIATSIDEAGDVSTADTGF